MLEMLMYQPSKNWRLKGKDEVRKDFVQR